MSSATSAPIERIERTWAVELAGLAAELASIAPGYGTSVAPLGGGRLVLCGPGLYVNRGLAMWLDRPATHDDLDVLEHEAATVGVSAALDVTPATHSTADTLLRERGYRVADRLSVLWQRLRERSDDADDGDGQDAAIVIEPAGADGLAAWQEVSAQGWGHVDAAARAASDAFAAAWHRRAGDGLLLARDAESGRWIGCAALTITEGIATLGGMTTLPDARGRGVQRALIVHRLRMAERAGCDVAATMAKPDSVSERNLLRVGFEPAYTKFIHELV